MKNTLIKFGLKQLKENAPFLAGLAAKFLWNEGKKKLIYKITIQDKNPIYDYLSKWLENNHKDKFSDLVINLEQFDKESGDFKFTQRNDSFYFLYNGYLIHLDKKVEKDDRGYGNYENNTYTLSSYNKNVISTLFKEVMNDYKTVKTDDDRLEVLTWRHDYWETYKKYHPKDLDDIILNDGVKEDILNSINTWKENNELLKKHKISTSLTHLYYGIPGSGKSSIISSIAHHYKMRLFYLDLQGIGSLDELKSAFEKLDTNSVLLIEEIDMVYKGRTKVNEMGVEFDKFINFLSGVLAKNDLIVIMTTNHIEHLDPALIRAGRVDLKCEFKAPTVSMVVDFLNKFYDCNIIEKDIKNLPSCMAELEQLCIKHIRDYKGVLKELNMSLDEKK